MAGVPEGARAAPGRKATPHLQLQDWGTETEAPRGVWGRDLLFLCFVPRPCSPSFTQQTMTDSRRAMRGLGFLVVMATLSMKCRDLHGCWGRWGTGAQRT